MILTLPQDTVFDGEYAFFRPARGGRQAYQARGNGFGVVVLAGGGTKRLCVVGRGFSPLLFASAADAEQFADDIMAGRWTPAETAGADKGRIRRGLCPLEASHA